VSTVQTYKSVSELTTRPRLGEDCWSRGLQSAVLLLVLRWGISHRWLLPWLMAAASPLPKGHGNRDLHALPCPLNRSSVVGLAMFLSAKAPSAVAVVAAIEGHRTSSPQSGVAATVQPPCHG
jgi:hypothetical protein